MHAGRGFLGNPLDHVPLLDEPARAFLHPLLDLREEVLLLLALGRLDQVGLALFDAGADENVQRRITAIIEDHVRATLFELEDLVAIFPVFLERLALHGENGRAAFRDDGGRVVLRREDIAARPAHVGAQRNQRLDQAGRLDRHVQRPGDPRAFKRLRLAILLPQGHQPRHLRLGDVQLPPAKAGEVDVADRAVFGCKAFRLVHVPCPFYSVRVPSHSAAAEAPNVRASSSARSVRSQLNPPSSAGTRPKWP